MTDMSLNRTVVVNKRKGKTYELLDMCRHPFE